MALQRQALNVNFAMGLDQKTDPKQVAPGKFLAIQNRLFNKAGLLEKRFGFPQLGTLPDTSNTFLTTFHNNLTAIGTSLNSYSAGSQTWINKGPIAPLELSVLPMVRSSSNQSQVDSVTASNGLVCAVYTEGSAFKYTILDSVTGEIIVQPTVIPVASGVVTGSPRIFLLKNYFMIVFNNVIAAVNNLQYVAINSLLPTTIIGNTTISSSYTPSSNVAFDGVVANSVLYLAWNGSDGGGAIRMVSINSTLVQSSTKTFATRVATIMSVAADVTGSTSVIYANFWDSASSKAYSLAVNQSLTTIMAPTQFIGSGTVVNMTSVAQNGQCDIFWEVTNAYSYDSSIPTNFVRTLFVNAANAHVDSTFLILRGVGLASKAFLVNGSIYFLTAYQSNAQPTYFLSNSTGNIIAKLAYSNGGGYLTKGLPNVTVNGSVAQFGYLFKDLIEPINKPTPTSSTASVYSQTGINLASFTIGTSTISTAEIGNDLHLSGGFLWMYDGDIPVEHQFHLWPDSIEITTSTTGGNLTAQDYYYVALYEWTDHQGNIFRSAPSLPVKQTTTGSTSTNTINVPTLRLTYKVANPVKIILYRWSTAQQTYYQVTSVTSPTLNNVTVDSVAITDTLADSSILGNSTLYTTGGVIENIGAPAANALTLYKSRLFLIDAEDPNLLWFSKQVIEGVPAEMSDLLTIFIAPTIGAQGNTGPLACLSAMDDKLILFKANAIYYLTGTGPDNTGANNDFSDPIFITSTVGCENQASIVFIPNGLIFQSDKGLWLLGRDLSTRYIGAPVEDYNDQTVLSALTIPGTNQVRFTLSGGSTLMYDYYYDQWTVQTVPGISSTLYQNKHTYIDALGRVFQESANTYLDGSRPVLSSFTTGWISLAGLQGYQRAYGFNFLGSYLSPHKLIVKIAYDYAEAPLQTTVIEPLNFSPNYGGDPIYGSSGVYGGPSKIEQWEIFFKKQKCQAFQITVEEVYDPSFGVAAGAGFTMSGLNLVVGLKGQSPKIRAIQSVG